MNNTKKYDNTNYFKFSIYYILRIDYIYIGLWVNKKHVLNRRFKRVLNRFKQRIKNEKNRKKTRYYLISV